MLQTQIILQDFYKLLMWQILLVLIYAIINITFLFTNNYLVNAKPH